MEKNFLPYGKQDINDEDIKSVNNVLKSDFLTQGTVHKEFERAVSKKVESKYCVSFNSATSGLHIACLALKLGKGDILWTTPNTFVASANCAIYCGAQIDFVDIEAHTGLMSIELLEVKLREASKVGKLPKIIIPVHLAGSSCDMPSIYNLSKEYGFRIIEDASHAIGGQCNDFKVGSCKYSDITVFSLHPVKIITSAEGGLATTNSESLYYLMRALSNHGIIKEKHRFLGNNYELWRYEQQSLGFNYRLSDVHAALGLSQLKRLDLFVQKRNEIACTYKEKLANLPLKTLIPYSFVKSTYHLFIVQLQIVDKEFHEYIFNYLRSKGIGVQLHYLPVHLQPFYLKMGFSEGLFPNSENFAISSFSLPIFTSLSNDDITRVVDALSSALKVNKNKF